MDWIETVRRTRPGYARRRWWDWVDWYAIGPDVVAAAFALVVGAMLLLWMTR